MTNTPVAASMPAARIEAMLVLPDGATPTDRGYLDTLGPGPAPQRRTVASVAMNSGFVSRIYEGPWRQGALPLLAAGMTMRSEIDKAVRDLRVGGSQTVLDVACGPGNFSGRFADLLGDDGLVVGIDMSAAMLEQAVDQNAGPRVGYVRGDAARLPFADAEFDAVCCYAALYLVDEPERVLAEMVRVLAPGGRLCVMTSCARLPGAVQRAWGGRRVGGVRLFGRDEITGLLRDAGCTRITLQMRGFAQFVQAYRG
ncbi:class I SAM-dependent methyltransferase [Tomitella cavernea]|uniref:Class I SAM-dependent methyltransferase n=1 Tax=Tomitella cavernea TaxID=1387982 RepID=A0ABP9CZX5_9ACTN|nr:methyltransferase domain-containing protein [Tomitella cavernea]